MWAECHVDRLPSGQNPSRETPTWTDSQVDRSKRAQNPDWTEPMKETILRGKNVVWQDSQEDRFQVDNHPGGLTPK